MAVGSIASSDSEHCTQVCYGPGRLIDGNTQTTFDSGACTQTGTLDENHYRAK